MILVRFFCHWIEVMSGFINLCATLRICQVVASSVSLEASSAHRDRALHSIVPAVSLYVTVPYLIFELIDFFFSSKGDLI